MLIKISAGKTLNAISEEFSARFPYLKLKFFSATHAVGEESSLWDTLNMSLPISEVGSFDHEEILEIHGDTLVSSMEQEFQRLFNIGVQVMRHDGQHWTQTTATDTWTLAQQNAEGQHTSV
jgi:hypothetical protein